MEDATNKKEDEKMLSQQGGSVSLAIPSIKGCRDNKQLRYYADPLIHRTKRKRGGVYYTYRQGESTEIYLGTADFILRAVTFYREVMKKQ